MSNQQPNPQPKPQQAEQQHDSHHDSHHQPERSPATAQTASEPTDPKLALEQQASHSPASKQSKVNVVIAGHSYSINCPADEEKQLKAAVFAINHFIHGIRQQAPNLSHENLLVLSCLNLYEKAHELQQHTNQLNHEVHQAQALIQTMLKDAQQLLQEPS